MASRSARRPGPSAPPDWQSDPLWYKDAIVYQLHVRAFADADGDGIGDFRGLTEKLDYLQDLGVTALWLLPFYPSPLRDDGYDISDYTDVHRMYGTLQDFKVFLREAHRRGLRVITELVLNHTSDQHAWFQRARRAPPGSRERDFYVWSDTPERYREARVIFKDFESSNWAWDPVARAYYWHRFYSHQPDLNFDSPHVRRAIFHVLDFWLGLGVDGLRLDAVPYLYEREGTSCENLPETHAFLRELRAYVDRRHPNRMLLAEANQWPEDAAAYFGQGDECHMAFHFPVMPRLFMGIHMEDHYPIVDILSETPQIPENSQWALFLRNHDELTLEMVTDEDRDYMYRVYASDPQARINLGIRRRLAPLLGNNRRKIELMNSLLFSLPGTPVIYYGDEIGMGDNIYLGDRNGVRTPMQWSADRNAGFSRANPQRLYLPVIIDPEYHYESINVEAQQRNVHSLLWWMKRLIQLRKSFQAFGRGSMELLFPENRKILAFLRRHPATAGEAILVVANLSRYVQYVELDLSAFRGMVPVELFGQTAFPPIGDLPYFVTLGPHAFYWFKIEAPPRPEARVAETVAEPPTIHLERPADFGHPKTKVPLERVLPRYLRSARWFGGKARAIRGALISGTVPLPVDEWPAQLAFVEVQYYGAPPESYIVPLAVAPAERAAEIRANHPAGLIAQLAGDGNGVVYDALYDKQFCAFLLDAIARRRQLKGPLGELRAIPTRLLRELRRADEQPPEPSWLKREQSNTSVVFGDRFILKLFRRAEEGTNPDLEIGRFLAERTWFRHVPRLAGSIELHRERREPVSIAMMQEWVANVGDAWQYTLDSLGRYFADALPHLEDLAPQSLPGAHPLSLVKEPPPPGVLERIGPFFSSAELLGQRTGELHAALASDPRDPAFAPEPFTPFYRRSLYQSVRTLVKQSLEQLARRARSLASELRPQAERLLELRREIFSRLELVRDRKIDAMRIRCHGDYHLGQVLHTGKDFVIIDFEGEPARPLSERRLKRSPLSDVAGMLRSFDYAAGVKLRSAEFRPEDLERLGGWARFWVFWVSVAFLRAYLEAVRPAGILPREADDLRALLDFHVLEKAVYELAYELNHRPDWVALPLAGILRILDAAAGAP